MTCRGRGRPSEIILPIFDSIFQGKYLIGSKKSRRRFFDPSIFFQTIIFLICGKNNEGYWHALIKVFGEIELPVKSALTKIRSRISYKFFEDIFFDSLSRFNGRAKLWNKLRVYAIDGLQVLLPRTPDIIKNGYTGRAVSRYRDTYYPRMYMTICFDILNKIVKDFREFSTLDEIADAKEMVEKMEKDSLVLYDRLYFSKRLLGAHKKAGNYFLMRLRTKGVIKEVTKIFNFKRNRCSIKYRGEKIELIKIKNSETNRYDYFATNLPKGWVGEEAISQLYSLRWEAETAFRDLVYTSTKMEQWHSKSMNGIRQELYARLWLFNFTRMQTGLLSKKIENPLDPLYFKPNYKLILDWIIERLKKIFKGSRGVLKNLKYVIKLSTQKRKRRSRRYKRVLKTPASNYKRENVLWNIEAIKHA